MEQFLTMENNDIWLTEAGEAGVGGV